MTVHWQMTWADGMKIKDGVFEVERKETDQEAVMRKLGGKAQVSLKRAGEEAVCQ